MTCRRSLSGTLRAGIGTIDPHPGFLFDEGETAIPLKLLSSQTFQTGALNLVYAPRRIRPHGHIRHKGAPAARRLTALLPSMTANAST
jgi:hypothetical protein